MSLTGIPSVMQMISSMPASAASMIASAANGGGTKISEQFASAFSRASRTLLKTAKPSCVAPPLRGVPHSVGGDQRKSRLRQNLFPQLDVRSFEAHDHRNRQSHFPRRAHHPL